MPEYLAPGVYVEEVSFRAKSIEGVSTSVAGFIGPTRYGPVGGEPELLTSFADFERIYGGIDSLLFRGDTDQEQINYMAHAVRAFFDNGGSKLYVTRVYQEPEAAGGAGAGAGGGGAGGEGGAGGGGGDAGDGDAGGEGGAGGGAGGGGGGGAGGVGGGAGGGNAAPVAAAFPGHSTGGFGAQANTLRARFPGRAGDMRITFAVKLGPNALSTGPNGQPRLTGLREHDVVYVRFHPTGNPPAVPASPPLAEGFYDVVEVGEALGLDNASTANPVLPAALAPAAAYSVNFVTVLVSVRRAGRFASEELIGEFSFHPQSRNALTGYFAQRPDSRGWHLSSPFALTGDYATGSELAAALITAPLLPRLRASLSADAELNSQNPPVKRPSPAELQVSFTLSGGSDGLLPNDSAYRGAETPTGKTGLETFRDIEEISIVAAPGSTRRTNTDLARINQITQHLLTHAETMRYRVAVLDSPDNFLLSEVRDFRGRFDSKYAALYYPWVRVLDPTDPDGRREIDLPPSGFVAGIYARNDAERGVFKAPANEVVRGAVGFEMLLNKAQQDVLNPLGINCFRFFEGRGHRLWGARTISSDPEWKYISVRRYFAYLEHSVDRGTQWAVFENNGDALWANIRRTIEDFLFNEWRGGALLGTKPEEAFFVRCDRSTMTQNDLDNGRLICLIGVAVVKPAEFVIFRIGQWTADRKV